MTTTPTSDLTQTQPATQFHTLFVRDIKDSTSAPTLHGIYPDRQSAEMDAAALALAWPDFLLVTVAPISPATLPAIADAQHIAHIPAQTDEDRARIRAALNAAAARHTTR